MSTVDIPESPIARCAQEVRDSSGVTPCIVMKFDGVLYQVGFISFFGSFWILMDFISLFKNRNSNKIYFFFSYFRFLLLNYFVLLQEYLA